MNEEKKTAAERIAEANERRAKKSAAEAAAREEQHASDLEAIEAVEERLGQKVHVSQQVKNFVKGLPVVVGVRAPDMAEYKRLYTLVGRSGSNADARGAALMQLGQVCWVYPEEKATKDLMIESNAALLASIGVFANSLAEVELREEGKE